MSDTIWVDVQGRAEDDLPADNSILLQLEKQLGKLASKLGVPNLTTFYDYSVLGDEFGDFAEDAESGDGNAVADQSESLGTWFDPDAALASVRALHQHLLLQPNDLGFKPGAAQAHWPADLMSELEHVQSMLKDAVAQNKKFRFLIVS